MLEFTILACLVAIAHAGTGYHYGPGVSGKLATGSASPIRYVNNNYEQIRIHQLPSLSPIENLPRPQESQEVYHVPKKTLNVMFIMAPEIGSGKDIEVKIKSPDTETETIIYLLSKQNDASEILGQLQQLQQSVQVRPEVMIIKYRTEEELESAVKAVQSKYDDLGGPSPLINGGVAPVINYANEGNELVR